ncbi:hypothetical protein GCM10011531_02510 [Aquaticitalea lipolytica]|uniref:DUF6602 domain-containing protein n=1 Tax=Aquaticitalea lipolytica TaxID=1247562 RepID=A0A8J2X8W8_9FLAO|nr:DUF6602 domain-containing protein [Aquaticitalea lipolytica]GFZ76727.1 hypothetical protein GCM10011531_02510 [Aquaticitalea lipolytica]
MIKKILSARIDLMRNLYSATSEINHTNEKGSFREFFISELIEPLLPNSYGIGSGIIVDNKGNQSTQLDIIIFDKRIMRPILSSGSSGVFPIDSVLAILEIKSKITSTEYKKLIPCLTKLIPPSEKNNRSDSLTISTSGNLENGITYYPFYAIFAYETDAADKFEHTRMFEQIAKSELIARIQLLAVMDKEILKNKLHPVNEYSFEFKSLQDYTSKNDLVIDFLKELLISLNKISDSRGKDSFENWL